jgi:ribonuclease P protein component
MTGNSSEKPSENAGQDASEEQGAPGSVSVSSLVGSNAGVSKVSATVVLGRLVKKADFEQVLAVPARSRSAHFAVHHVGSRPSVPIWRRRAADEEELSTTHTPAIDKPVDDFQASLWLGAVVPKRHARRSVTRSLLKRQIREALANHAEQLPAGMWLIRLRSPFPQSQFPSAASRALRHAARAELDQLLAKVRR